MCSMPKETEKLLDRCVPRKALVHISLVVAVVMVEGEDGTQEVAVEARVAVEVHLVHDRGVKIAEEVHHGREVLVDQQVQKRLPRVPATTPEVVRDQEEVQDRVPSLPGDQDRHHTKRTVEGIRKMTLVAILVPSLVVTSFVYKMDGRT